MKSSRRRVNRHFSFEIVLTFVTVSICIVKDKFNVFNSTIIDGSID